MREVLPNAHFPVKGVITSSEDRSKVKQKQQRRGRAQARQIRNLKNGRTPYVITSESPGPAEYVIQPDASFLPPPPPLLKNDTVKKNKNAPSDGTEGENENKMEDLGSTESVGSSSINKQQQQQHNMIEDIDTMTNKSKEEDGNDDIDQSTLKESIVMSSDEDDGWSSDDDDEVLMEDTVNEFNMKKWTTEELDSLWNKYDVNKSGQISFGEIERAVLDYFPELDNKEALKQAYRFADFDKSGLITKSEFHTLLGALSFFHLQWQKFDYIDKNGDMCIDISEFVKGRASIGLGSLSIKQAEEVFKEMDHDSSGKIRFFELCAYLSKQLEKLARQQEEGNSQMTSMNSKSLIGGGGEMIKVEARPMKDLARVPGVTVPIPQAGRISFKTIFSGLETQETIASPGPVYDISGDLKKKSHSVTKRATFGTSKRFIESYKHSGPGPGKYNGRDCNHQLERKPREGGAAVLKSDEARTMLHDNARRNWGHSKFDNGAFYAPEKDYFQRPSQHSSSANPISKIKNKKNANIYSFTRSKKTTSYLPKINHDVDAPYVDDGKNRMDEPISNLVLSTSLPAPSHSFGTGGKEIKVKSLGPGPGAYSTSDGALTSVGDGKSLLLPKHGAPSYTFGRGEDERESNPVIDKKLGIIYGPAAKKPMTDAEKREAALRGLGVVKKSSIIPGVGAYDIDLGAKLEAVLRAKRQMIQFPDKSTTTFLGDAETIATAVAQMPASPCFSFASTGREDRLRVFAGSQFMDEGKFSPDTPGHFLKPFPAPTFRPEKSNSSQSYTMAGENIKRTNANPSYTDSFPDSRYDVLESCAGEQSQASPYKSSPVFTIAKGSRVAATSNGIRKASSRLDVEAIYMDYRGGVQKDNEKLNLKNTMKKDDATTRSYSSTSSKLHFSLPTKRSGKPDRRYPIDSPGPNYYSTMSAMEALDAGGVPDRKTGIKLTQAKRFEAFKRNDGTIVEHPFDAIQTQILLKGADVSTKKKTKGGTRRMKLGSSDTISLGSTTTFSTASSPAASPVQNKQEQRGHAN